MKLILQGKSLPNHLLASIVAPFGFFPTESTKIEFIFEEMTKILRSKFSKLDLENATDILLTYIYAEKYPDYLFNEKFQQKVKRTLKQKKSKSIILLRKKMQIIDSVMNLEMGNYGKRKFQWLDKEKVASLTDLRIRQTIEKIKEQLMSFGGNERIGIELILGKLPLIDIYNVDILIFPNVVRLPIVQVPMNDIKNCKVILINLPEHYCFGGNDLIGPQLLRIRVLRKLGFQVATLDYEILSRLEKHSVEMKNYLAKQIDSAM